MNASITRAADRLDEFHKQLDGNLLDAAVDDLERVVVSAEPDAGRQRALRKDALELWLMVVAAVDAHLDPAFDPADLPSVSVSPPRVGDVQYPPGVDPSVIRDPAARQEYERQIAASDEKALHYNLQVKLRRLDERLPSRVERFVFATYTTNEADTQELDQAIQELVLDRRRAERLRRRLVLRTGAE